MKPIEDDVRWGYSDCEMFFTSQVQVGVTAGGCTQVNNIFTEVEKFDF